MDIVFETPRLLARKFTPADAALVLALNSDTEVLKYIHEVQLRDEMHALKILNDIILPQYTHKLGRWAIHIKDSNEFIGWCGLKHRFELSKVDLGYRFKRSAWGNGYATEAARHTIEYGFTQLRLPLITACAHIDNIASWKVLEKIGMLFTGEGVVDGCQVRQYEACRSLDGLGRLEV